MPKKPKQQTSPTTPPRPSALLDTRVVYCGDNLDQLAKLPDRSVDLIYIDPPFNSNRNYEVFWCETEEKRAFEDRHASHYLPTHDQSVTIDDSNGKKTPEQCKATRSIEAYTPRKRRKASC